MASAGFSRTFFTFDGKSTPNLVAVPSQALRANVFIDDTTYANWAERLFADPGIDGVTISVLGGFVVTSNVAYAYRPFQRNVIASIPDATLNAGVFFFATDDFTSSVYGTLHLSDGATWNTVDAFGEMLFSLGGGAVPVMERWPAGFDVYDGTVYGGRHLKFALSQDPGNRWVPHSTLGKLLVDESVPDGPILAYTDADGNVQTVEFGLDFARLRLDDTGGGFSQTKVAVGAASMSVNNGTVQSADSLQPTSRRETFTSALGMGSYQLCRSFTVQTTNANATIIGSIPLDSSPGMTQLEVRVVGRRTGGAAGAVGAGGSALIRASYTLLAGVATRVNSSISFNEQEFNPATWSADFVESGGSVDIYVVGGANNNVDWFAYSQEMVVA